MSLSDKLVLSFYGFKLALVFFGNLFKSLLYYSFMLGLTSFNLLADLLLSLPLHVLHPVFKLLYPPLAVSLPLDPRPCHLVLDTIDHVPSLRAGPLLPRLVRRSLPLPRLLPLARPLALSQLQALLGLLRGFPRAVLQGAPGLVRVVSHTLEVKGARTLEVLNKLGVVRSQGTEVNVVEGGEVFELRILLGLKLGAQGGQG